MKILIAEDKKLLAEDIKDRLEGFGYRSIIGPYANGEEAFEHCLKELPDIALLDINLEGAIDGITLANKLNSIKNIPIIYLTNQEDEATYQKSEKTFPVAFINKPFTNNELKIALKNAVKASGEEVSAYDSEDLKIVDDRIFVRNGRGKISVDLDDILWIQSHGGETSSIITVENRNDNPKKRPVVGHNLSRLEDRLKFYPYLKRASRFHIINLKRVDRILDANASKGKSSKKAVLISDEEIVLGDKYRKQITDQFHIL